MGPLLHFEIRGSSQQCARVQLCQGQAGLFDQRLPGGGTQGDKVDLRALLADLARRGCNELHVEAGFKLNGSLLREGLVDELLLYLAPKLLGPGQGVAAIGPLVALSEGPQLDFVSCDAVGPDLRVVARVRGHAEF